MRAPRATVVAALAASVLSTTTTAVDASTGTTTVEAPRRVARLDPDYPGMAPGTNPAAEGRARLTLLRADNAICYRVHVTGMTTRGVYVHRRSDDVLVTRLYDEAPTDADVIEGCVTDVPSSVLRAFRETPTRFYVTAFSYDGLDEIGGTLRRPA